MRTASSSGNVSLDSEAQMYDAIIVDARCAGSPTAMLLARPGFKVLLVDRTTFPSDTISTHIWALIGDASYNRDPIARFQCRTRMSAASWLPRGAWSSTAERRRERGAMSCT
jgi:choline dehydrogenase-like flavoprotein